MAALDDSDDDLNETIEVNLLDTTSSTAAALDMAVMGFTAVPPLIPPMDLEVAVPVTCEDAATPNMALPGNGDGNLKFFFSI